MTAREDYPLIASHAEYVGERHEWNLVLDEIDHLRADVAKLLAMCAQAGAEWPRT